MITFKKLTIENFLSFECADIELDNQGLVLIKGKNKESQSFDSNGSGKSAIFEAFLWCLWGQTIRELKADEVVNLKIKKNCLVTLELEDDQDNLWIIKRARKHKEFENRVMLFEGSLDKPWNKDEKVQEKIDSLIGHDFKSFTSINVFYQGGSKSFTGSTDSEQKKLLERLYDLEKYSVLLELASKKVKSLSVNRTSALNAVQTAESQVERLINELQDLYKDEKGYVYDIKAEITKLAEELETEKAKGGNKEKIANCTKDIDLYEHTLKNLRKDVGKISEELEVLEERKEKVNYKINFVNTEIWKAQSKIDEYNKRMKKFTIELKGDCPTCEQPISSGHKEVHIMGLEDKLETERKEITEQEQRLGELNNDLKIVKTQIAEMKKKEQDIKSSILNYMDDIRNLEKVKSNLEIANSKQLSNIRSLENSIMEKEGRVKKNPYTPMIDNKEEELKKLGDNYNSYNKNVEVIEKSLKHYEFLEKAFSRSGIPNILLDNILPALNNYANEYSNILTGGTIEIEFSNQVMVKKEVREKFEVRATNKVGASSYKGDSSGEKRRVDLCVMMALQKVAALRSKSRFNLMFLDEVFDTLDNSGIEDAIELLDGELEVFPSIFVISHNPEFITYFDKVINVEKKNGLSSISS